MLTVQASDVASSRLHGRVVIGTDPSLPSLEEIDRLLYAPIHGWKADHHEGTGALLTREQYAPILRRLADAILDPTGSADVVHARGTSVLYPDAATEAPGETTARVAAVRTPLGPDRLVVIYACARSGTTWLELLLSAHPDAGGPETAETFVFHDLTRLWSERGPSIAPALRDYCDDVFGASLDGGQWFIEKTPLHTQCIDLINAVYPDAWSVHLVRDGRDVARSLAEVSIFDEVGVEMDVRTGARLWRSVVEGVRSAAPSLHRFREIRYESLVAQPAHLTVSLMEWAGMKATPDIIREINRRTEQQVSVHGSTGNAGPGKWHTLSASDLGAIYEECGALLVSEGYVSVEEVREATGGPLRKLMNKVIR